TRRALIPPSGGPRCVNQPGLPDHPGQNPLYTSRSPGRPRGPRNCAPAQPAGPRCASPRRQQLATDPASRRAWPPPPPDTSLARIAAGLEPAPASSRQQARDAGGRAQSPVARITSEALITAVTLLPSARPSWRTASTVIDATRRTPLADSST